MFFALATDAVAAPALPARTARPVVITAPAHGHGARVFTRSHRAFRPARFNRFAPAYLAPVAAAPQPAEPIVQQPVTVVQQAPLPPVYRHAVCSGPMIISIRPSKPKSARRAVAPHAGPEIVYGFPLPCPETGGLRRAYYREGTGSVAY
jgi:hypothetical protein